MTRSRHVLLLAPAAIVVTGLVVSAGQTSGRPQSPARDTPAQRTPPAPAPKGRISGRVVTADTGRPVRQVRILVTTPEIPNGRSAMTDDEGRYEIKELPAGRYTVNASKAGFITLSYGQRRPRQAGTPLQLADAQQLSGIDFSLPRGSAVAGHIYDETGEPLVGASVRVLRYQYAQGRRQLMPTGSAQTDDQGYYRVWGLNPGEYYISAQVRSFGGGRGIPVPPGAVAWRGAAGAGGGSPGAPLGILADNLLLPGLQPLADAVAYGPAYYPGAPTIAGAQAIRLDLAAEALNIDFRVVPVRMARLAGRVTKVNGAPATGGAILLQADTGQGLRGGPGDVLAGPVQADSSFSIANVPPGTYALQFRDNPNDVPQFTVERLTFADGEVRDMDVTLVAGGSIAGTVTFQATQSSVATGMNQGRVMTQAVDDLTASPPVSSRIERDGAFTIDGVSPGSHWLRWQGGARGWALKSITVAGRDVTDSPIEIKSGQKLTGVAIVLTDQLSEVSGTVTDASGTPIAELTVLAFPSDAELWRPQSRHIMTARPDQNGRYQIRGLPPGEYYLATIDPVEQGEWFEPAFLEQYRAMATRVTIGDGDIKTHDFKVGTR